MLCVPYLSLSLSLSIKYWGRECGGREWMPGDEAGAGDDEWEGLGHDDATAKGSDPDFVLYRFQIFLSGSDLHSIKLIPDPKKQPIKKSNPESNSVMVLT